MAFEERLRRLNIDPITYLDIARRQAKKYGLNYETLQFSHTKTKKLSIRNDYNKLVNFGSSINNDFIIWKIMEKRGKVRKGYAKMKHYVFHTSHEAMKYNKSNPYSANNLSLRVLW